MKMPPHSVRQRAEFGQNGGGYSFPRSWFCCNLWLSMPGVAMVNIKQSKTAVVVIHGIGEQRPMETIWDFVQTAWVGNTKLIEPARSEVWLKPEELLKSFELRRITTRGIGNDHGRRFDFFEYYWAHHMTGHTFGRVLDWVRRLFIRTPCTVPRGLGLAWLAGIALLLTVSWLFLAYFYPDSLGFGLSARDKSLIGVAVGGLPVVFNLLVLNFIGDAAAYLNPAPYNVEARQKIRQGGVDLIEAITSHGSYDRIIVVGHSLGAVIAYDIVNFAWNRCDQALKALHTSGSAASSALEAVEAAARDLVAADQGQIGARRIAYREAQRHYRRALAAGEKPAWLISDLVTLGAPLSKAEILIGRNLDDLQARIARRELPACPPVLETGPPARFSFPVRAADRRPHHAAVMAPVVWTNIYFPHALIVIGDIIAGPVRHLFGRGIVDVKVPLGWRLWFRHLDYWRSGSKAAVAALHPALNLADEPSEAILWTQQAGAEEIRADRL